MNSIQKIQEYIAQHAWINQIITVAIIIFATYILYRFLMSSKASFIRQKIEPLRDFYNSRQIRLLVKQGEYAKAGETLLEMGEADGGHAGAPRPA